MKSLILSFITIMTTSLAFAAATLDDLAGVYDVHSTEIAIRSVLTIKKDGDDPYRGKIFFKTERSPFGKLNCKGTSVINVEENTLETESQCKSGLDFQHTVELEGISNFDDFSTYIRDTLLTDGKRILMYFERKK